MLISHTHKFIFIHIIKTAGTSIMRALEKYDNRPRVHKMVDRLTLLSESPLFKPYPVVKKPLRILKSKVSYSTRNGYRYHVRASELQKDFPKKIFDNYFKFAFVRNPWDWQVSNYHFILKNQKHKRHQLIKELGSFEAYLDWRVNEHKVLQKSYCVDENGKLIVDFVGKYENLSEDFSRICKILKINTFLPYENRSSHRDYRSYYNNRTRRLIEEHYKEDIEMFEYYNF